MANPEHLEILKRGVEAWNKWRSEHEDVRPDLSRAILRDANLSRANLSLANLSRADLSYSDLRGASLSGATISDARISNADIRYASINDADLCRANLSHAILDGADLSLVDLSAADLSGTEFSGADFSRANLSGADLVNAYLNGVHLNDANLNRVDFSGGYLSDANLSRADLTSANFTNLTLGYISFGGNDLSQVKGLETVIHSAPSYLSIDTIYKSQGNIPEIFLRKAGVPEDFITYMRSLTAQPIQFYTCFISFTEADDTFSECLYNDLQAKGVRCWRWKEDAKWGKTLMRSIDEAVRVYDKLIAICSEESLNAPAVIREIERALQKEDDLVREGRDAEVLFPIRLDDYIFAGWNHHRKADVTAKNVGDFTLWKDHDSYRKAFDRLLRDLRAEEKKA